MFVKKKKKNYKIEADANLPSNFIKLFAFYILQSTVDSCGLFILILDLNLIRFVRILYMAKRRAY